jgi:RHS repeat-associated protein
MFVRALLAVVVLSAAAAQAATRQVNGAAGCSDTTGTPYCTINKAILAAANGDTIQIASGAYAGTIANFSKPLTFAGAGSGTSGTVITKPMTYTGTGPLSLSSLRLQGGGTNFKIGGTGNFSGLTLTDAAFIGNGTGAHGMFIKQNGSVSNVTVMNCIFNSHGQSGFLIQRGTGSVTNVDSVTVSGSTFDGNGECGFRSDPRTTNLHIAGSNITNNAIDGLLFLNADGVALDDLTITGNRNGILLIPLASTEAISNVTLTNVTASNNTRFISGQYGSGLTLSATTGSISQITATNSSFSGNSIHGVSTSGAVSQVSIGCSVIAGNGQDGVHDASSPSAEVKAEHVYWGCPTGPNTAGCSTVTGNVDVTPYRAASDASCTGTTVSSIEIAPSTATLNQGQSTQFTATATYSDGTTDDVTNTADWTSSAATVAGVDAGDVSALSPGVATITATLSGQSASASVTVLPLLRSYLVSPSSAVLWVNELQDFSAVATYSDGTTSDLTGTSQWSSGDPGIASIDAGGHVTAHAAGTARIQAESTELGRTAIAFVTVMPPLTSIQLTPALAHLTAGASRPLTVIGHFGDTETDELTSRAVWSSSDPAIATVGISGIVAGIEPGTATITATVAGFSSTTTFVIEAAIPSPPDPATIASPINPTVVTTVYESTRFLYEGTPRVQTGVAPGTIERERAAVLRGRVRQRDGSSLAGVRITVLSHPEFGQTFSRTDGWFDLAVNGGGALTLRYERDGYMSLQRQLPVGWNNYAMAPEVMMTAYDANVTTIASGASSYQAAWGSPVVDERGSRRELLLFAPGTQATMRLPGGSTQSLASLNVRATEYTVGADGIDAMPAALPPESGYTYCVELSADEAIAAGATSVHFDRPVVTYLDAFIGFPVGTNVPNGYYDRERGVWVAAPDGRVVMIMLIVEGRAYLDVDGDGAVDAPSVLEPLGITTAEREVLGSLYHVGQKLWRVQVDHFTPWDRNWYQFVDPEGESFDTPSTSDSGLWKPAANCSIGCGSIIGIEDQTLGEHVGVTGTPFSLSYTSRNAPGFIPSYHFTVSLTGETQPRLVTGVELAISTAGKSVRHVTGPAADQKYNFTWDGLDAYGRRMQGSMSANVNLTYEYVGLYRFPNGRNYTFADVSKLENEGLLPAVPLPKLRPRVSVNWAVPLGDWVATGSALGGWTLSAHHTYDPLRKVLHMGDGSQRMAEAIGPVVETVAGNGECCESAGDGGPAAMAALDSPRALAVASDGTVFVAERTRVRRIGRDNVITTIAGNGSSAQSGSDHDGLSDGPARSVAVTPVDMAIDSNDTLYLSEGSRVRKLSGGRLSTIAGNGSPGRDGDDGLATSARINPFGIAAARDGSVVVVDADTSLNRRLRRISTAGRVTTIAGTGSGGNGTPAVEASIGKTMGVAVGPSGTIYLTDVDEGETRRIRLDTTIGSYGPSDGSFSTDFIGDAAAIAVDEEENVYFGPTVTGTNGESLRFVGGGNDLGEGGLALAASINHLRDVAVGPGGMRYIIDQNRVLRVSSTMPGLGVTEIAIPSKDGGEIYIFNPDGRHLRTEDAVTGVLRYRFEYDEAGLLSAVIDVDDNTTSIERNAAGEPTAIVASGGQRTTLAFNTDGYLAEIGNPSGEATTLAYWPGGLLRTFTDPNQNSSSFTYGPTGRLIQDTDAAGGHTILARSGNNIEYAVSTTSAEGRTQSYTVTNDQDGSTQQSSTDASGLASSTSRDGKGGTTVSVPAGMEMTGMEKPDVRFGMQAPVGNASLKTPSGLQIIVEVTRTLLRSDQDDPDSELLSIQSKLNVNGRESTSTYHRTSRTMTATSPLGRASSGVLDAKGHLRSMTVPGVVSIGFVYDGRGRLTGMSQGSRTMTLDYDERNRLTTTTDPLDRTLSYEYDDADRVTRQTFDDGRFIGFTYDDKDNLTSVTPPSRPQHSYMMTPVDSTASYTPPPVANGGPTLYDYNRDRQLTLVTRPDSKTIALGYDEGGRMSSLTIGRGAYTFDYHASSGQLRSIASPDGNGITYSYDGSLVTQASWTGAVTGSISWQYDDSFRVRSETVACATASTVGCQPVAYSFDEDDLLLSAGALNLQRRSDNGLLAGTTIGNLADEWTYNSFAEPVTYKAVYQGVPVFGQQYTRDDLGRITQRVETIAGVSVTRIYRYHDSGRLEEVQTDGAVTARYTYDENGNRLTKTGPEGSESATVDDQDRLWTNNGMLFAYTANGELLSKTDSHGTATFDYDELGNLLKVVPADGRTIEYITDAKNRRIGKKIDGVLVQRWVYSGVLSPAAELDGQGNVVARFVYATRPNVPDLIVKDDVTYRVITDHLGSPRLIVNADSGAIEQQIDYDEFGNVISDSSPGFQPFGFAGGLFDRDTGLVRFGVRDYDPRVGRWIAKEPVPFEGRDSNLYAYAFSDPVNLRDANGRWVVIDEVGGAVIGAAISSGSYLVGQLIRHHSFRCVSGKDLAIVAGVGFVAGFFATDTLGASVAVGASSNVMQGVLIDMAHGRRTSGNDVATSAATGALGGIVSYGIKGAIAAQPANVARGADRYHMPTTRSNDAIDAAPRNFVGGYVSNADPACGCDQ